MKKYCMVGDSVIYGIYEFFWYGGFIGCWLMLGWVYKGKCMLGWMGGV